MRALFSIVSLLVVVALVGLLAARQFKGGVPAPGAPEVASPGIAPAPSAASPDGRSAGASNVREQSRQLQGRVRDDLSRALQQGAAARNDAEPAR